MAQGGVLADRTAQSQTTFLPQLDLANQHIGEIFRKGPERLRNRIHALKHEIIDQSLPDFFLNGNICIDKEDV